MCLPLQPVPSVNTQRLDSHFSFEALHPTSPPDTFPVFIFPVSFFFFGGGGWGGVGLLFLLLFCFFRSPNFQYVPRLKVRLVADCYLMASAVPLD